MHSARLYVLLGTIPPPTVLRESGKEDEQASRLVSTGYLWRSCSILVHRYTEYTRLAAVHNYLAPDQEPFEWLR